MRLNKLLQGVACFAVAQASVFGAVLVPDFTNNRITFTGDTAAGHGITGWPTGHRVAPIGEGPYIQDAYVVISGRGSGPDAVPGNALAAEGSSIASGFANFSLAYQSTGSPFSDLGVSFGNKVGDFTKSWNLGADQRNVNWTWDAATMVEERFYTANPGDVFLALTYQQTPIVMMDYSDISMRLDFAAGELFGFNNPTHAFKANGLNAAQEDLADAFLLDVNANGGRVQFIFEVDGDPLTQSDFVHAGLGGANFSGIASLQVVPEPHEYGLAGAGALMVFGLFRRWRQARAA